MFNFIDHLHFIPMSGCVGSCPRALLFPGAYNAVKTTLPILMFYFLLSLPANVNDISYVPPLSTITPTNTNFKDINSHI